MITLIKKEKEYSTYGLRSKAWFTPYYFDKGDGVERFFWNLVTGTNDSFQTDEKHRKELASLLSNFRKHDYKYTTEYCGKFDCPFEFIKWMKKQKYTFDGAKLQYSHNNTFCDFCGNVLQYSHSFHFRIYDKAMLKRLKNSLSRMTKGKYYSYPEEKKKQFII